MRNVSCLLVTILVVILTFASVAAWSQNAQFSPRELDEILAPIALYPDPLLAQIFPAATFPDQLNEAADITGFQPSSDVIDNQNWDGSVKAVAYYPDVLRMMVEKPDWAISIGQAYDQQPNDVLNSIQRLRFKARGLGYLRSTPQQRVYVEGGYLRVVPVGDSIYVPVYDPEVVYVRSGVPDAYVFAAGFLIGAWLNRDVDWHNHNVYYHGWSGSGWYSHYGSRFRGNGIYVNDYYRDHRVFTSDHSIRGRDIRGFRESVHTARPGSFRIAGDIRRPGVDRRFGAPPTRTREAIGRTPGFGRTDSVRPGTRVPGGRTDSTRPGTRVPGGGVSTSTKPGTRVPSTGRPSLFGNTGGRSTGTNNGRSTSTGRFGSSSGSSTGKPGGSTSSTGRSGRTTKPNSTTGNNSLFGKTGGSSTGSSSGRTGRSSTSSSSVKTGRSSTGSSSGRTGGSSTSSSSGRTRGSSGSSVGRTGAPSTSSSSGRAGGSSTRSSSSSSRSKSDSSKSKDKDKSSH